MLHRRAEEGALAARYALLTFREREVMSLLVAELANQQIAGRLGITEMTSDSPRQGDAEDASLRELVRMAERLFPGPGREPGLTLRPHPCAARCRSPRGAHPR